jgi:DNA-binding transcriptional MerR regulator
MENDIKHYRIGEFARKVGVSPDFLKYQEEFSVVNPQQSENSNYRYYAFAQAGRVFASIGLQNMGFTLREIESILTQDTSDELLHRLTAREAELEEEIARFRAYQAYIHDVQRARERDCSVAPWYVEQIAAFAYLPHSVRHDFVDDEGLLSALRQWTKWLPVVSSAQRIECTIETDGAASASNFSWGLMVGLDFAQAQGLVLDAPIRTVLSQRVLTYYQCLELDEGVAKDARLALENILQAPLALVRNNRLSITGEIYHRILYNSHEKGKRVLHSVLYFLLKQ